MKRIMSTFKNKSRADMSTILYGLMGIITIIMIMIIIYRKQFISIAITNIDDGLTASVLGSAVINIDEYGKSGQMIIYNDLPDKYKVDVVGGDPDVVGIIADSEADFLAIGGVDFTSIEKEQELAYLDGSYNKFIALLKANLGLDDNMVPTGENALLSSQYIDDESDTEGDVLKPNVVKVDFRIYNVYKYYKDGEMKKYIVEFKRVGGEWNGKALENGDGVDFVDIEGIGKIEETSVYAGISFYMYIGTDFNGKAQYTKVDNMSRLVEVTGD